MQDIRQAIQRGYAALQRGAFSEAREHLRNVEHPNAIHLLGLVEKSDGNLGRASELLSKAAKLDPKDADLANNRASLARDTGDMDLAELEFRRALKLRPGFTQPGVGLGRLLIDQERWDDALSVYNELAALMPDDVAIRYGRATALLGAGHAEEAEQSFNELIQQGNQDSQIAFMRGRARLELGDNAAALSDLEHAHQSGPSDFTLRTLAGAYWMMRRQDDFDRLMRAAEQTPMLAVTCAEILRQSGEPQRALDTIENARQQLTLPAQSWSVAATAHIDLEQAELAEAAASECLRHNPDDRLIRGSLISSLLMQGKAEQALPYIEAMRNREPDGQHWIAYQATAWRLLGRDEYRSLVDLDRFVRSYELPTPAGFSSIEEFNAGFLSALDSWHKFETHPLDQSLRFGSQTPRDLTAIDDPVIQAYIEALDEPLRDYMAAVGTGEDHPLTARNTGDYKIAGCWSVRLSGRGHHVNHVHPEGWISSCYYVTVPDEAANDVDKPGWIKFGEAPFSTMPETAAEKWIQPEAGLLVLFPSFLWHGTQPIHDGSVRVTAPFDAIPA